MVGHQGHQPAHGGYELRDVAARGLVEVRVSQFAYCGNAHGAATSGMTHWGDPVATRTNSMHGNMQYQRMENSAGMGAMAPNSANGAVENGQ